MVMRHRRPPIRVRSGAAIVEMAIILPLLMVLTFGVIEYGWLFLKASQVNNAARQGVRVAIRPDASEEEVEAAVDSVMENADLGDTEYDVETTGIDSASGEAVTVTVDLTYDGVDLTGFGMLPLPESVHGEATMSKEGPPDDDDD